MDEAPYSVVSEYHFVDEKAECVSFHILPLQWSSDGERQGGEKVKIFLHGTADNGIQIICKHVVAWKFDISSHEPKIMVLSGEGNSWIKLGKPRKSFEENVRSILVAVHCIHYVNRNNPEKSGESLWSHLYEVFRLYAVRPSQRDLVDHMPLIADCVKRYRGLAESKFLANLFEEKTMKRKLSDDDTDARKKLKLITDDIKDDKIDDADDEDNNNLFGEVCALCDDGGDIICCEGGCLRSFHATVEAGAGSYCKSLGLMPDDVVGIQNFYCKNCEHKQHQCFVCGKLGSSDKSSGAAEVLSCVAPNCGRFYHPHCVAILLNQDNGVSAEELERKIAGGDSFTCPIHKCFSCKRGENTKDSELQFALCMRCPKSYHRKCLPREIAFENQGEMVEGRSITRAWDGLLPNRILIYCTKHDIDIEIGTVRRDHIKFPDVKQNTSSLKKKKTILEEKWKPMSEFLEGKDKVVSKRNISLENPQGRKMARTKKPFFQKKKTRELMSDQKPVSKKTNYSSEESGGQRSDPLLSELVREQKLSSVKKKKNFSKEKTIVEKKEDSTVSVDRNEAVLKRRVPSSEGLFKAGSAPTVSKQKQKPSFVEEKNRKLVRKSKLFEEKRTLISESLVDKETTVSEKKNSPLTSGIDISRMVKQNGLLKKELQNFMCEKTKTSLRDQHPNPSKSHFHCVHGNGQIQSNIPDDLGRRCTTSKDESCLSFTSHCSGSEKRCKRENSGKAYSNGMKQKQETEFDIACTIEKQDPTSSNNMAGENSVYDHIRTFSSTFYSHIGLVADSLSSINRSATASSDATKLATALDICMGFARGPHLNYSLQNSAGWIDE